MIDEQAPRMGERAWRLWAAVIALTAWSGLVLQAFEVFWRVHSWAVTLWRLALFFTIFSNLTVAITFSAIALGVRRLRHPFVLAGLAMTMALVGTVFELMLRRTLHLAGGRLVSNALLHDAVPLLTIGAWFVLAEKGRLRLRDPWLIALFPIVYLGYALIRGATGGFYPYPFIDPVRIGWIGVLGYVVAITAVFLLFGYGVVRLDRWLATKANARHS